MLIYETMAEYAASAECDAAVALGMFDGVHLGHAALINEAVRLAAAHGLRAVALTYTASPLSVLDPAHAPRLLQLTADKLQAMTQHGLDATVCIPFTLDYARSSGRAFARGLAETLRAKYIVVGFNYSFGKGGQCGPEELCEWGQEFGYEVRVIPPVEVDGVAVSSSRIRNALASGEIERVNAMLGRAYSMEGIVEQGKHMGRKLGFPTANLKVPNGVALPRAGVYVAEMEIDGGTALPGVLNIGRHPTLPEGHATVETNCLLEVGDIYGRQLNVRFLHFARPERKFASVDELRAQIAADKTAALQYFNIL